MKLQTFALLAVVLLSGLVIAGEPTLPPASAERGWQVLRTKAFLPPDFDRQVFEELWKSWPEPLRSQAEKATPEERRAMAFSYYGLVEPVERPGNGPALGYLSDGKSGWVMTCLACHAGRVDGQTVPGLGNNEFALETLTNDVRATKLRLGKPLSHLDLAQLTMPLGSTVGTTNAVMFGVALGASRTPDMDVNLAQPPPVMRHHDVDAPAWWNVKYKSAFYIDGFAPKAHRPLMQFMLLPRNSGPTVRGWEADFADVLAYIESIEAPGYSGPIDTELAQRGRSLFMDHCARCHGTYDGKVDYPEVNVPLHEIGTDPVRLQALSVEHRKWMKVGWMSRYGKDPVVVEPQGYVAPPLVGVWATAPYLHNGSVPTLAALLNPAERPTVWKRVGTEYDHTAMGLHYEASPAIPSSIVSPAERRCYFDTRARGKSAAGHDFAAGLTDGERRELLEFLKLL